MRIPEYLDWRGDIPFTVSALNPVDEYIICKAGMPDLKGLVPEGEEYIPVGRAAEGYRASGRGLDRVPPLMGSMTVTLLPWARTMA